MASFSPQSGVPRKQLKAVDLVRTANWLRSHDRMLVEEKYTSERARLKINEELKLDMTPSNLRSARKCVPEMRWRPYAERTSHKNVINPPLLCIGAEIEKILTFMEMEVPSRIKVLAEEYRKFLENSNEKA